MICRAAVKIYDKRQDKEIVIPCHRHCDAFQILHDFGYRKNIDFHEIAQGFLNEHDNFLNRVEAWIEANQCCQFLDSYIEEHIGDYIGPTELYSEDLW